MNRALKVSLAILLLLTLAVGVALIIDLGYPSQWNQIHLGMSRSDVESLIGPDPGEMKGMAPAHWSDRGIFIRNRLELYIDPKDGVTIISIQRFSTIPIERRLWDVRNEYARPSVK